MRTDTMLKRVYVESKRFRINSLGNNVLFQRILKVAVHIRWGLIRISTTTCSLEEGNTQSRHGPYRFVASLGSGTYFLTANEHVVAVGESRVRWHEHGVEWAHRGGILIQYEEVRVVLGLYQLPQSQLQR
jgi:hypothetical protein